MKNYSMDAFTHYCQLVLEDMIFYNEKGKCEFLHVMMEINNANKYRTFFNMITDSDEEHERLDGQYYNTLCMILGLSKHDEENDIITQSEIDILFEYIQKMTV